MNRKMTKKEDEADQQSSDMIGFLLVAAALAMGGGGVAAGTASHGSPVNHPPAVVSTAHPHPISTVCNQYFRGGC